ncbi:MAG: hypothetical protein HQ492_10265 [Woeseiaceae bacterium]|nr:hypothetical protein [Woeseiaceae bacterium]
MGRANEIPVCEQIEFLEREVVCLSDEIDCLAKVFDAARNWSIYSGREVETKLMIAVIDHEDHLAARVPNLRRLAGAMTKKELGALVQSL